MSTQQAVRPDMGPTATVPYSHYWTFNHEENHDNFAGADHLDFSYQIDGMERQPVSGPKSAYDGLSNPTACSSTHQAKSGLYFG